eukprot:CAMPEP_0172829140 /NCGR_PEP_ID=MMETSP1075-20121228/21324_1 /TAXON_ID=2916 /ORGANISM="Ceratium fusus, Strain PA161109" /LENGTH=442 /DNA_ID=CAMNT_0013671231 /DNA_START=51 /DNA_END=1380 /DNA_ORIENTATION=+
MEEAQVTMDSPARSRRRTSPPGGLSEVPSIESELVQRNREIAHMRDQLGQRQVETTTWQDRHGFLVGKFTDLEGEAAKLKVQVRELCSRLQESQEKQLAFRTRAEKAEAELRKQEAEANAQLEAERTSASKHAANLESRLASERSARLAAETKLESLLVHQQTKQHIQQQGQFQPKQRRQSLPELRLELVSAAPGQKENQEQGVAAAERETTASKAFGQIREVPAPACWLTLAASDPSLLGLLEHVEAVCTSDGHNVVGNVRGGSGERAQTDLGMAAVAPCSKSAPQAVTAVAAALAAAPAALPALPPAPAQIVEGRRVGSSVSTTSTAVSATSTVQSEEAEQLRLSKVEVKALEQRLAEGLAMAAEDAVGHRNQGLEVASGALAREALIAAQLEETRRARSVERGPLSTGLANYMVALQVVPEDALQHQKQLPPTAAAALP